MEEKAPRRMRRFDRQEESNLEIQEKQIGRETETKRQEKIKDIFMSLGRKASGQEKEKKGFFSGIFGFGKKQRKAEEKKTIFPDKQAEKQPVQQQQITGREAAGKKTVPEELFNELRRQKKKEAKKESINLAVDEIKRFKETNNRFPTEPEYDEIAENIYQQIKQSDLEAKEEAQKEPVPESAAESQRRQYLRRGRKQAPAMQPAEKPIEKKQPATTGIESQLKGINFEKLEKLDVKELFRDNEEDSELKLEDILSESGDDLKLEGLDEGIDSLSKEFETEKNNCPNCKEKTEEIIFCPGCGTAFCSHCAKGAKTEAGITKYVCPKCNREVKAQK